MHLIYTSVYSYICLLMFGMLTLCLACSNEQAEEALTDQNPPAEEIEGTFKNPLLPKGADPWVIRENGMYYYTHTTGNRLDLRAVSTMEDLHKAERKTIWIPPEGKHYSQALWAPELHYLDGKWYMYFAASYHSGEKHSINENRRMYVIENSSEDPMKGEWKFKGKVTDDTDRWAIDGTVFKHEDGERYFIWSGWRGTDHENNSGRQQLYIAKMLNPWTLEGKRVMISEPEYQWEKNGLVNEGPVILKNNAGSVFLFYSASGCWTDDYKIGVLRLKDNGNPLNPGNWEKYPDPLFKKNIANSVYAPGHNSFFKSPDGTEDWILYHANNNSGDGCGASRSPRMQKISWNANGFPELGEPVSVNTSLTVPSR